MEAKEYKSFELPDNVFNVASGSVVDYNGQLVRVENTGRGTRYVRPLSSQEVEERNYQQQLSRTREANKPAIQSLQSEIPEVQGRFQTERTRLESEKDPLNDRYDQLIASIRGRETKETNAVTKNVAREYGRRGIPLSSSAYADEETERLNPVREFYTGAEKDTQLAREEGLKGISDLITRLTGDETSAVRAIKNAIAQLEAGAANTANTNSIQMTLANMDNLLKTRSLDESIRQNQIANSLASRKFEEYELPYIKYVTNKPYYKETSGSSTDDISSLYNTFNQGYERVG